MTRHLDELTSAGTPWGKCPEVEAEAVLRRVEDSLNAFPEGRRPPMTKIKRLRFPLVLAAALALLTVTALAFVSSLRELIAASLGPRAPYATEVLGSCEDMGVTIEARSALTDGRVVRLYFTVQDPSGVFFLEDTDNDLFVEPITETGEGSNGGTGLERLSYDPETQTGLYVYSRGLYPDVVGPITEARLTMTEYLPGSRWAGLSLDGPNFASDNRGNVPAEPLESATENGAVVLLPDQNPQSLGEDCPEVSISSMGFASDGYYHIRLHQEPGITQAYSWVFNTEPFQILYLWGDPANPEDDCQQYDERDGLTVTPVSDGWDYRLSYVTPETLEGLRLLYIQSHYSVSGGYITGNWEMTVPVEQVEARTTQPAETLILSRTKDSPPPSGRNDEAQVAAVSVSPLSVAVDFVTPEGHEYPASINGEETACAVTLKDGTVLEPAYYSETWGGRKGWVMWEFDRPVDPEQVVSVTLNGNEVLF